DLGKRRPQLRNVLDHLDAYDAIKNRIGEGQPRRRREDERAAAGAVKCRTEELPRPVDPDNSSTGCRDCPHEPAAGASKIKDETGLHVAQPLQGSPQLEVVRRDIAGEHAGRRQLVEATRDQPFDLAQNRSSIATLWVSQASA